MTVLGLLLSVRALDLSGDFLNLDRMPVAGELAIRGIGEDRRRRRAVTHSQQAFD